MTQQTLSVVEFHGHPLTLIEHDGQPYVAMRPVCDAIGLDPDAQLKRIKRHPVMNTCTVMTTVQVPGDDQLRQIVSLPLSLLNGWLFGIDTSRVKPELRETLVAYQRECFDVLYRHWHGEGVVPAAPPARFPRVGEADAVVDANRMFQAYMRSASAMKLPAHRAAPAANARVLGRTGIDLLEDLGVSEADLQPQALSQAQAEIAAVDPWSDALDQWLQGREAVRSQEAADYLKGKPATLSDVMRVASLLKAKGWRSKKERGVGTRCGGGTVWRRKEVAHV